MDTNNQPQPHPQPHSPIPPPAWILALRAAQFLLSIIILGLAGGIIHWVYLDELGFAVAVVRPPPLSPRHSLFLRP